MIDTNAVVGEVQGSFELRVEGLVGRLHVGCVDLQFGVGAGRPVVEPGDVAEKCPVSFAADLVDDPSDNAADVGDVHFAPFKQFREGRGECRIFRVNECHSCLSLIGRRQSPLCCVLPNSS